MFGSVGITCWHVSFLGLFCMDQLFNIVYVVGAVLCLFGAAIFVHEFGHYWVARRLGMKVEAFAIGFGPKIFGWTKDGIEYSWRWIPAGGYVKLPQMITSEALEGSSGGEPVPPAKPWHKMLVAVAGPAMNVVFAFFIGGVIYFVGLPVMVDPSVVGFVEPGSPEHQAGVREGDIVVEVNGKPVKSWFEVNTITALARTNILPVVMDRKGQRVTLQLSAKASDAIDGLKVLDLNPRGHPEVIEVQTTGAAFEAGVKSKDVILQFAGVPIYSREQLIDLIKKRGGQATDMRIERGQQKLTLTITPKEDPTLKVGRIGVALGNSSTQFYQVQRPGPTPWAQVSDVWDKTVQTVSALAHSKQTGVGAKDLSGPVGILAILAAQVNTDYRLALSFLVLLNINLAIMNLLPVPVLDGGHIVLSLIEWVRRRPLSPKLQEYTTTAFALVLISFMLYVTFFDLRRFGRFKALFRNDTQIEQGPAGGGGATPTTAPASGK